MDHIHKRILVTGGAGFLGSHLSERLLKDGCDVLCVDNFYTGTKRNIVHLLEYSSNQILCYEPRTCGCKALG